MITCVIPTRGLIFARTLLSLKANGITDPVIVSGLPLPDAHNEAVKQGLATNPDYIFMCEDDMEIPDNAIARMLQEDLPVVAIDYPIIEGGKFSSVTYRQGKVAHVSFGCTLFKREVFEQMPYPWFENDNSLDNRTWQPINKPHKYGGHDIWFSYKLAKLGIPFGVVKGWQAKHLRCEQLSRILTNQGAYTIKPLSPMLKY